MTTAQSKVSRIEAWFGALKGWRRAGLALIAGGVAALGYAPLYFAPAFALGIVVLIWLCDASYDRPRRWRAFFNLGWLWGLGHCLVGMYWISSPFMVDPESYGVLWAAPATLAFTGGLALFWGAGLALASFFWTRDWRRVAMFAACIFVSEFARGNLFTGFPWNLPGYIWPAGGAISQTASVVGIYGLSLITLLAAASPATIADSALTIPRRVAPALAAVLALGLMWGSGVNRLNTSQVTLPGETPVVRVADSGLSQAEKWVNRPDQEWRVLARLMRATQSSEESHAQVVIWPEGAVPTVNFFTLENQQFLSAVGRGLGDRVLIMGLTRRDRANNGDIVYYNSAAIIDGVAGLPRISQIYDKHHLVPFGEYIPFFPAVERFASFLRSVGVPLSIAPLQEIGEGFAVGPRPSRLVVPDAPTAVVLICYEAIFPGLIPRGADRPGWIVSVSNDAWFGAGAGPQQHFNIARYRAIEEGLPMARAASGGVSGVVDAFGRPLVLTQTQSGGGEAQLPRALSETFYARWGSLLTALLFGAIAALRLVRARTPRGGPG